LTCWIADGLCSRKLKRDDFLGQHVVDVCLLTETHLGAGEAFRMANYVCNRTDRLTERGGTAILVRRSIDHCAVPVKSKKHPEAAAVQVMLASKPVKILAVYLSPSQPVIDSDLSACRGGGLRVPIAGDLNAKNVDWNSRLSTTRGSLLRNYDSEHSCLIDGLDTPTAVPYNSSSTPNTSLSQKT